MVIGAGLVVGLQGLGTVIQGATQAVSTGVSIYRDIGRGIINANTAVIKGLTGLNFSMRSFSQAFGGGLSAAKTIQQQASLLGLQFTSVSRMMTDQLKDLPGSLAKNMQSSLMLYGAGIRGNTQAAVSLAATIRLGGGDHRAFTAQLIKAYKARAMDQLELAEYSNSIREASISNQVNMQSLANTMGDFVAQTDELRLFMDPKQLAALDSVITKFIAKAGPGTDALAKAFAQFLAPDWGNKIIALMTGLDEARNRLLSGFGTDADARKIVEGIVGFTEKITGGMSPEMQKDMLEGLGLHELAVAFGKGKAGLDDFIIEMVKDPDWKEKWATTIQGLQEKMDKPLELLGMSMIAIAEKYGPEAAEALGAVTASIASAITDFFSDVKPGEITALLDRMIETWKTLWEVSKGLLIAFGFGEVDDATGKLVKGYDTATNIFYKMTIMMMGGLSLLLRAFAVVAEGLGAAVSFITGDEESGILKDAVKGMRRIAGEMDIAKINTMLQGAGPEAALEEVGKLRGDDKGTQNDERRRQTGHLEAIETRLGKLITILEDARIAAALEAQNLPPQKGSPTPEPDPNSGSGGGGP